MSHRLPPEERFEEIYRRHLDAVVAYVRRRASRTAFARLSERDRELLALVAWEGLTLAETAGALGCSPLACRVRLHRAKRRLAQRLDEAEELSSRPHPTPHPRGGEAR